MLKHTILTVATATKPAWLLHPHLNEPDLLQAYSLPIWSTAGIPECCSGLRCDRPSACGAGAG
ncbi:MAG: hypothetical protein ACFCU6_11130 [Balneolaceae bacterium]